GCATRRSPCKREASAITPSPSSSTSIPVEYVAGDAQAESASVRPMSATPLYEIYAVKYAQLARQAFGNFVGADAHETSDMPLDYYVWVIVGADRVFVVDTGFDGEVGKKRGR